MKPIESGRIDVVKLDYIYCCKLILFVRLILITQGLKLVVLIYSCISILFQPVKRTPAITSNVPAICSAKIFSPNI